MQILRRPHVYIMVGQSTAYPDIIIAVLNGELTVKRLYAHQKTIILCAENENYGDIKITEYDDFSTWGVVTNVIHLL